VSVVHLRPRHLTAIEISLDLAGDSIFSPAAAPCPPAEPRVCLVVGFALTAQLERVASAIERSLPARLPARLRVLPFAARVPTAPPRIAIQPMRALIRLQSTLVRAIEPGLVCEETAIASGVRSDMNDAAVKFVRDFVPYKVLPTLEASYVDQSFPTRFTAKAISLCCLGADGLPEVVLKRWQYPRNANGVPDR